MEFLRPRLARLDDVFPTHSIQLLTVARLLHAHLLFISFKLLLFNLPCWIVPSDLLSGDIKYLSLYFRVPLSILSSVSV